MSNAAETGREGKGPPRHPEGWGEQIRGMFDAIAPRYDLLNRILSLGSDVRWRRFAVNLIGETKGGWVLDLASGTGDVALEVMRQKGDVRVVGVDFSLNMLRLAAGKVRRDGSGGSVRLVSSAGERMPFREGTFRAALIAFGIRNFADLSEGLSEVRRVLKDDGVLVVLELSEPRGVIFAPIFHFYFHRLLPLLGGVVSKKGAYRYLPSSVSGFPSPEGFEGLMKGSGFRDVRHYRLSGGIAVAYLGVR